MPAPQHLIDSQHPQRFELVGVQHHVADQFLSGIQNAPGCQRRAFASIHQILHPASRIHHANHALTFDHSRDMIQQIKIRGCDKKPVCSVGASLVAFSGSILQYPWQVLTSLTQALVPIRK